MSAPERIQSFVPLESVPLPRPLHRFGAAFPALLATMILFKDGREAQRVVGYQPKAMLLERLQQHIS